MKRWTGTSGLWRSLCLMAALGLVLGSGCSKKPQATPEVPPMGGGPEAQPGAMGAGGGSEFCDFIKGPADAKVKVVAFYPGRHEDTLAAVKSLLDTFPGKVQVEIVDWRREEGLRQRDATGLTCAGVMINDRNAFELEVEGKKTKVLFNRGIDGEWSKPELEAAVKNEIAAKGG